MYKPGAINLSILSSIFYQDYDVVTIWYSDINTFSGQNLLFPRPSIIIWILICHFLYQIQRKNYFRLTNNI